MKIYLSIITLCTLLILTVLYLETKGVNVPVKTKKTVQKPVKLEDMQKVEAPPTRSTKTSNNSEGVHYTLQADFGMENISAYVRYMGLLGNKFVIYNQIDNKVVCRVQNGELREAGSISHYSKMVRNITDDFPSSEAPRKQINENGYDSYRILLLITKEYERKLFSRINAVIVNSGIKVSDVKHVKVIYKRVDSHGLLVEVVELRGFFNTKRISKTFYL